MTTQQESAATAGQAAAANAAAADEILYENDHTRVSRRRVPGDGSSVIVKLAIGAQAIRRLEHEVGILKRLAAVDGVAKIAESGAEANTLVLRDAHSPSLAQLLRTQALAVPQVVAVATALARTLSAVHRAGVVHQDIGPANILVDPVTLATTLIDFNIAIGHGASSAGAEGQAEIAGTWQYMSPEQTGRTGRMPDARSDLYSLGITLYELTAGRKPFESQDLLELVHDHLVKIPEPPALVNDAVPKALSDIVMRLLQKEPDRRYQSADGLLQDLDQLRNRLAAGDGSAFELGRFDFGVRLNPPARLIGRDTELAALRDALARCADGHHRCLLVSGDEGLGKSKLLEQLRVMVPGQKAWYVAASFSRERQDTAEAAFDFFQALGRQLLAEPAQRLAQHRERLLAGLQDHLGFGPLNLPEFERLLGKQPEATCTDAAELAMRHTQAALALLRCVASPERPLVMVFDDVQWAPSLCHRLVEAVVRHEAPIPGLLLVGAYHSSEVSHGHPLHDLVARRHGDTPAVPIVVLGGLSAAAGAELVGEVLRLSVAEAGPLAQALAVRTQNNPRNLLERLNGLRDDGVLSLNHGRWTWDAGAVHRYVGPARPAELQHRLNGLAPAAREMLQALACLGVAVNRAAAAQAIGLDPAVLAQGVQPLLDDGVVVGPDGQPDTLQLANERVREAALGTMDADECSALHLALARRLDAQAGHDTALEPLAAQQYLAGTAAITDATEAAHAVALFDQAAQRLRLSALDEAERFLAAALRLVKTHGPVCDAKTVFALECEHHRALFTKGRLAEADALYEALSAHAAHPSETLESTRIQIYSLMNRRRFVDAMNLGLGVLDRLGLPKPADVRPAMGEGVKRVVMWCRSEDKAKDLTAPEISDPQVVSWSMMVPETSNPAYFVDPVTWAWLGLEAHRIWVDHGPSPRLLSSLGALMMVLTATPQDFRGAYNLGRHVLAVGETRGYEPATSFCRVMFGIAGAHWVDPIESVVEQVFRRARADLMRIGDESFVSHTYLASDLLLDCAPKIDAAAADIEEGIAFAARSNNHDFIQRYQSRRHVIKALKGQTRGGGAFTTDDFDEDAYAASLDPTGPGAATYHIFRSLSALVFGDLKALLTHSAKAVPLTARTPGYYINVLARAGRAVALAAQMRASPEADRAPLVEELDGLLKWMAARASDAPANFLHLQRWLEAERAWSLDTVWAAGAAFDAAVQESLQHDRPWHKAIIHERAAMFHLAHGMEHTARPLLTLACELYEGWGAAGKVRELKRAHAFLRTSGKARNDGTTTTTVVDNQMVDMMAVLRASQALSSETSLVKLTQAVGKVLGAITGATGVQLVVRADEGSDNWVLAQSLGSEGEPVTVEQAGSAGEFPLSVFRYAERTGELLVIDDAARDDRFSSDPYVEKFDQCSMLLSPILKQGQLNAMLMLQNEQRRAAFSGDRLDSVSMIAGQLSVSLDNALLYASLEKRVAERTAQLRQKTNDINAMLQNMPQGVLTVVPGGTIHPEYSAYLETIFETREVAMQPVMALVFGTSSSLGEDILSQVDAAVGSCIGEDEMNYEFNQHLLVTEFDKTMADGRVKSLALSWSPICSDEGVIDKLMLCVRDVTELKRLEQEASKRKRELQLIGEILAVTQEKFHEFIDSARSFIDDNRRLIEQAQGKSEDTVGLLFRNMHTIKGNARTHGLLGLTNLVHVTEQAYDELRKSDEAPWDPQALLEQLERVREQVEQYAHINDVVLGRKGPGRRAGVEKFLMVEREAVQQALQLLLSVDRADNQAMAQALNEVGRTLHLIGTQPLQDILSGTLDSLPSLAQELGKVAPQVQIEDHGIVVRTQASGLLRNLFTHLLRNSVDHGIEAPAQRQAAGKPDAGLISIAMQVDDGRLFIRLRDDGRGLAIGRIRQKALDAGLIEPAQAASAQTVAQLIFQSGLSTATEVTEVSGRGVGMDAVKGFVEKEGGSIDIVLLGGDEDADFRPFETVIALPDKYAASLSAAMSFDALRAGWLAGSAVSPQ
ncbi:MAG: AAA family ATPase [Burkholderiales bacterium]|nr:AAA family ATPase [Burkholderiales bacterium]